MENNTNPATGALALAMMNSFGQLSIILTHMCRSRAEGHSDPDAPPPPFVLERLIASVLTALAEQHDVQDIATAAQMLTSATELIGEELFIVDMDRVHDAEEAD